jgi:hypothetical protein
MTSWSSQPPAMFDRRSIDYWIAGKNIGRGRMPMQGVIQTERAICAVGRRVALELLQPPSYQLPPNLRLLGAVIEHPKLRLAERFESPKRLLIFIAPIYSR